MGPAESRNQSSLGPVPSLYLAGPLFSAAELRFNLRLKRKLARHFDVYLPQEDGELLVKLVQQGVPVPIAYRRIYMRDIEAIRKADLVLIVLDGRTIDEGAAFEVGFAKALGKTCYGLQTDPRRLLLLGNNPMIQCSLEKTFRNERELASWAASFSLDNNVLRVGTGSPIP